MFLVHNCENSFKKQHLRYDKYISITAEYVKWYLKWNTIAFTTKINILKLGRSAAFWNTPDLGTAILEEASRIFPVHFHSLNRTLAIDFIARLATTSRGDLNRQPLDPRPYLRAYSCNNIIGLNSRWQTHARISLGLSAFAWGAYSVRVPILAKRVAYFITYSVSLFTYRKPRERRSDACWSMKRML